MTDLELALAKHDYRLDGEKLVNVTAISGLIDDGKSSAFAGSAVKITKEGGDYRAQWKEAGERGTRVHGYCESFLRGESIEMVETDTGFVDALEKFMIEHDPKLIELEEVVLSSLGYGGRLDMIVEIDGENWLIDTKSGKSYAVEHTLQLSAYRFAEGIAQYGEDGSLSGLRSVPRIDRTACLYVKEDGTYELTEYPADRLAFGVFIGLLGAYQWTRTPEIKELANRWRKK